jgi:hypothetical protein
VAAVPSGPNWTPPSTILIKRKYMRVNFLFNIGRGMLRGYFDVSVGRASFEVYNLTCNFGQSV